MWARAFAAVRFGAKHRCHVEKSFATRYFWKRPMAPSWQERNSKGVGNVFRLLLNLPWYIHHGNYSGRRLHSMDDFSKEAPDISTYSPAGIPYVVQRLTRRNSLAGARLGNLFGITSNLGCRKTLRPSRRIAKLRGPINLDDLLNATYRRLIHMSYGAIKLKFPSY